MDDLVAAGYLDRAPDPGDRRAVLVSVTPAGSDLSQQISQIRGVQSRRFLAALDEADRAQLRRILLLLEDSQA